MLVAQSSRLPQKSRRRPKEVDENNMINPHLSCPNAFVGHPCLYNRWIPAKLVLVKPVLAKLVLVKTGNGEWGNMRE
ncbi:MAG: hypothetical protein Q6358_09515 [Candidatus Brocadiales bacterium]|nr:hypothetical protein [Candidatus Brocadiales bacterium]